MREDKERNYERIQFLKEILSSRSFIYAKYYMEGAVIAANLLRNYSIAKRLIVRSLSFAYDHQDILSIFIEALKLKHISCFQYTHIRILERSLSMARENGELLRKRNKKDNLFNYIIEILLNYRVRRTLRKQMVLESNRNMNITDNDIISWRSVGKLSSYNEN